VEFGDPSKSADVLPPFDLNELIEDSPDYLLVTKDGLPPICPVECPKPEKYGAAGGLGIATEGDGEALDLPTRGGFPPIFPVECPMPEETGAAGGVRAGMTMPMKLEKTGDGAGLAGEGASEIEETKFCPMGDALQRPICVVACPKPEMLATSQVS
jgi:hypothetical protein